MRTRLGIGMVGIGALAAGIFLGGAAMRVTQARVAHAQEAKATPPGYVIAEVQVSDMDLMKRYGAKARGIIAQYGGKYVILGGRVVTEEGEPSKGFVVLQFASFERAKEWYESPEYSAVRPIRQKAAKSRLIIEEGVKE